MINFYKWLTMQLALLKNFKFCKKMNIFILNDLVLFRLNI